VYCVAQTVLTAAHTIHLIVRHGSHAFSVTHDLCCCRMCAKKKLESTQRIEFVRCFLSDPVVAALNNCHAWYGVVTAVLMKVQYLWDVITCRSEDWLIDLHWVRALTVPMHLGLIDGPFVLLIRYQLRRTMPLYHSSRSPPLRLKILTHCGRVTQICVFNTVKLGTSASSP